MRPSGATCGPAPAGRAGTVISGGAPGLHLFGLTVAMLRYRVAIMVWTFMLIGAAAGDGARLNPARLLPVACALGWSYVAATTVNDIADVEIDLVNHPGDAGRPLVTGAAAKADMSKLHWLGWGAALACSAAVGLTPMAMVAAGLVIGRAYSTAPLRLSYRPYLAPLTLALAYVVLPYGLGLWSSGHVPGRPALALGAALTAMFLARIILKDFRDREGDALFGRRSILLVHGKRATCLLSGVFIGVGDLALCFALGVRSWPFLLVAQGFLAMVFLMLVRLSKVSAPRGEQVAIGTGAKMANGLLLSVLSWLLALGHQAPLGTSAAFVVFLMTLYGASFLTLARYPDNAVIGYKG